MSAPAYLPAIASGFPFNTGKNRDRAFNPRYPARGFHRENMDSDHRPAVFGGIPVNLHSLSRLVPIFDQQQHRGDGCCDGRNEIGEIGQTYQLHGKSLRRHRVTDFTADVASRSSDRQRIWPELAEAKAA